MTQEQRAYIRAHANDHPREAIAEAIGIGIATLYRELRRIGGEQKRVNREKMKECVRQYYPTMSAGEIAERFGFTPRQADHWARKQGIEHTPATRERLERKARANLRAGKSEEMCRTHGRRQHRLWQREYERWWEGKPQQTNLHLSQTTHRAYKAKWYLRHAYHYAFHPTEPYTMVITPATRRSPREGHYEKVHRIRFINQIQNDYDSSNIDFERTESGRFGGVSDYSMQDV